MRALRQITGTLMNNVTMWDVAAERQVEITGSDAFRFVEYITSRDLSKLQIGQGKYALITDEDGGIINDPIILRLGRVIFGYRLQTATYSFGPVGLPVDLDGTLIFVSQMSLP